MKQISITKAVKIKNDRVKSFEGERQYLATGGLVENKIITEAVTYQGKPSRADLLVSCDQIIVAKMKDTNKVALIDQNTKDLIVSTGFLVLEVQEGWHPKFLFHYLESDFFQKQKDRLSSGATQKALNNGKFKEILIPEIPLEDQKKIAQILDNANSLRQKRKQAIELLDDYLKSVFLEMFGDPITNPKGWEKKPLGEVSFVRIGPFGSLLHKHDYVSGGTPLVNPCHLIEMKICIDVKKTISDKKMQELEAYRLHEGDVVLGRRGEIGRCGYVSKNEEGYLCGTGSIFIRPEKSLNPIYLTRLLSTSQMSRELEIHAVGITMKNLNAGIVKKISIPVPSCELQNKFADIISKTKKLKSAMTSQAVELENNFNALMQKAFKSEL